jgi:hypothetical protein
MKLWSISTRVIPKRIRFGKIRKFEFLKVNFIGISNLIPSYPENSLFVKAENLSPIIVIHPEFTYLYLNKVDIKDIKSFFKKHFYDIVAIKFRKDKNKFLVWTKEHLKKSKEVVPPAKLLEAIIIAKNLRV